MDVSPEGQGEVCYLRLSGPTRHSFQTSFLFLCVNVCLSFAEVLPEMENQGEYEGQNFNFTSPDNMDNGGSQNLTKLTTANMEDMEEYYNFGKDTSSYTTP